MENKKFLIDRDAYLAAKNNLIVTYETLFDIRKRFLNDEQFRRRLSSTCCILTFKEEKAQKIYMKNKGVERMGLQKKIQMIIKDYFSSDQNKTLFQGKIIKIERAPEPSDIIWTNC